MKETYSKTEGHVTIEKLEKLGLIGCKSNLIKYDNVFDFKNGYVIVEKNDKLGLFDTKNNNIVIDIKYDDIRYLDGGSIVLERGGTYEVFNFEEKSFTQLEIDDIYEFNWKNGVSIVESNGKYGFMDQNGKIIGRIEYDKLCEFQNGYSSVSKSNLFGIVDDYGNLVVEPKYDSIWPLPDGKIIRKKGGHFDIFF